MTKSKKPWTVAELICWSAQREKTTYPVSILLSLTCKSLRYEDTPPEALAAVTAFRHLRQDARLNKIRRVLLAQVATGIRNS